jgi:hypothetical protein
LKAFDKVVSKTMCNELRHNHNFSKDIRRPNGQLTALASDAPPIRQRAL